MMRLVVMGSLLAVLAVPTWGQVAPPVDSTDVPFAVAPAPAARLAALDDLLAEAAENNPKLRARFRDYRAELEAIPQAESLPDPEVMFNFFLTPPEADPLPGRFAVGATQRLPWVGTLSARGERASRFAEAERRRFERAKLNLFRDVTQAWVAYAGIRRTVSLVQQNLDLLDTLVRLVDVRYETDEARRVDVLRVRMEQDKLETRLRRLEEKRQPARARLNELLGREPGAPVDVPTRLPDAPLAVENEARGLVGSEEDATAGLNAPVDSLTATLLDVATERDPSLQALAAEADGHRAARQVAEKEGRPDFGLGVEVRGRNFGPMRMMDSGESAFAKLSIRVPLFREKYRARQRQATAKRERARLEQDQRRSRLATQIESLVQDHRDATRTIALHRNDLLPKTAQSLDILEEEYAGGRVGFDEVLDMQRQLLDYAVRLTDAQVRQHQVRAELQALIGGGAPIRATYEDRATYEE